jgi:hypothetical protein
MLLVFVSLRNLFEAKPAHPSRVRCSFLVGSKPKRGKCRSFSFRFVPNFFLAKPVHPINVKKLKDKEAKGTEKNTKVKDV